MASKLPAGQPMASASATPAPSSPPPSESFFSELDGTAPSVLDTSGEFQWDVGTSGHGLNLVSWKKGVEEEEEGTDKRGFYAISTVLNHPTKKANPLRSTRKPLPPLGPAPPIPKPPSATHFDDYLKAVTPLYDTLQQTRAAADASPADVLTGAFDKQAPAPSDLPSLSTVPDLFFSKEFDLADPSIWSQVVEAGPSRASPSTSVHDHLSSHLDTLERHLIHEITLRSTSFFSALSNLQDLHSESASCLRRISDLQAGLREVGSQQARKGLTILDKMEDLRVLRVTERGMGELREAEEVMAVARGLVEGGDWAGALGCVSDVVRWWERHRPNEEDEPPDPTDEEIEDAEMEDFALPLSTLPALLPLPLSVSDLTIQIALQLEAALQSYLLSALSSAELDVPYDKERFRDHVVPIVEGLIRCGAGDAVEGVWREVVTLAVREGSRKHLPVAQAEDEGHELVEQEMRGATLASALKSMDHSRYLLLASQMYSSILARLRLAQQLGPDLSSILTSASSLPPLRIPSIIPTAENAESDTPTPLSIDQAEIIASGCELGNLRASKILAVRGEQHAGLGINEFVELFKENWAFVLSTEVLAQRMIASLRGVTASQARTFLIAYHSQRLTKSAKLVEEEQWNQIDVTSSMQHSVNLLIESAVSDPPECFIPSRQPVSNGHSAALSKTLDVEEAKFFVVRATAESIGLLADYLGVVVNLEVVVTDVMGRIIEFLKSFNSRTCQVVLGAGAMRSAGLKNITAKHLALASQSLSAIVALIPYIREFIRRHLSVKQAVMLTEFDKLKRDYQEHQNEIHAKLVAIMSDRLAVHVGSLRDIDWEATPDKDGPRAYAELLVKETATLHKVLGKYLSPSTVEAVMSEVLAAITHRLSEEYSRIELKSEEGKKRMMQDTALITARLTPLSEAGKSVSSLEVLVKDKPVPRKNIIGNLLKRGGKKGDGKSVINEKGEQVDDEEYDDGDDEVGEDGDGVNVANGETETTAETVDGPASASTEHAEGSRDAPEAQTSSETDPVGTVANDIPEPVKSVGVATEAETETQITDPTPVVAPDDTLPTPVSEPSPSPIPPTPATQSTEVLPPLSIITAPPAPSRPASPLPPLPPPTPSPNAISPPATSLSTLTSPPATYTDIRSPSGLPPLPASPSPAPSPSSAEFSTALRSIRAPRVSLANRLKGVITRAGSVDRETEPMVSPPIYQGSEQQRGSVEGLRRSLEGDRPAMQTPPPPVPDKEKVGGVEGVEVAEKGEEVMIPVEIVSPVPRRISTEVSIPLEITQTEEVVRTLTPEGGAEGDSTELKKAEHVEESQKENQDGEEASAAEGQGIEEGVQKKDGEETVAVEKNS